ncbi:MAG: deoxyribonuclease IV [Victivallaceae bacterium]
MKYIGAHVSAGGGVENAPLNAAMIGAGAFALFTKNQRQWHSTPLSGQAIENFKNNCIAQNYTGDKILAHDSYLINLGQPEADKLALCRSSFVEEMRRCAQLGIKLLNFHPGSHLNEIPLTECLRRIAESINIALAEVPEVVAVIENTAGQGTNVGFRFEQIGEIISQVKEVERVGLCVDTCHTHAAGYDWHGDGYENIFSEIDKYVGLKYLRGMHLNDAKCEVGAKLDRHESIGKGKIGWEVFARLMQDPRLNDMPLILETPDDSLWAQEIAELKKLATD